jgi:IclR family pca regulon transcriptional regulator
MAKLLAKHALARADNPAGRDFSEALARGLSVIGLFGPDDTALTISEAAERLDLPRATARRALLTLAALGYAEEDGRRYRLTPKVLRLAGAYLGASLASTIFQPACAALSAENGETFSMAALDGDDVVMIAYAHRRRMFDGGGAGVGLRMPAYCSAVGRVLLAGLPPEERDAYLKRLQPQQVTSHTVTDKAALRRILNQVDQDGYSIAVEEAEVGFRSLAVPIVHPAGLARYALNVGRLASAPPDDITRFLPILKHAARELQAQLI